MTKGSTSEEPVTLPEYAGRCRILGSNLIAGGFIIYGRKHTVEKSQLQRSVAKQSSKARTDAELSLKGSRLGLWEVQAGGLSLPGLHRPYLKVVARRRTQWCHVRLNDANTG